jgi:O-antigen/teichoic acid export membrane protein
LGDSESTHRMGIVIQRSGYAVLLSYVGFFVGYVNMLWLLPLAFQPEEVGLIRLIMAVSTMFATLSSFGGTQVATRFFPYFADSEYRRAAFIRLLLSLALAGAFISFLCLFLFHDRIAAIYSAKSPLLVTYFWYIIPITASLVLYGIVEALVVVQGHPLVPTLVREIYVRATITVAALAFLAAVVTLRGFIGIVSVLYCLAPLLLFLYGKRKGLLPIIGTADSIHRTEVKDLSQFGAFMFLGNASAVVLANIDSVVLSAYTGLANAGIYGIAMFIAVIIEIPKRSLSQVLIPLVVKANREQDFVSLGMLYKKSSLNQFIIGAAIFLVVWTNIDSIFSLIPNGHIYREGKLVVLLVSVAKLFDMLTGINAEIIGTSRFYKIDLLIYFALSLVGIGLNMFLIPLYGVNGAALAMFTSVVLYNSMRFVFIALAMKIQPFTRNIAFAFICALATYGVVSLVPTLPVAVVDVVVRSLVIGLVFGSMIIGFKISEDISGTFNKVLQRVGFHS